MTTGATLRLPSRQMAMPAAGAFTLVEVLTVIVIISLLLSVALPSIHKIRQNILRTQSLATVHLLAGACDYYRQDMNEYPPSAPGSMGGYAMRGRHRLVECLTGYLPATADRVDGFGFRLADRGTVYGPYHGAENVRTKPRSGSSSGPAYVPGPPFAFYDSFDNEILYFRYDTNTNSYHAGDDVDAPNELDVGGDYIRKSPGGAYFTMAYAIMSAGPDKLFSSFAHNSTTDDVTSFLHD